MARSESATVTPNCGTGNGTCQMPARHRAELLLVGRDLAGQRRAHQRASVEGAGEGDDVGAAGRGAGDLDSVLDSFGAGREKDRLGLARERRDLVQPFAELDIWLVGHDLEGGVGEGVELFLHRRDHLRVAVAGVEHGDAAGEVDEALAVAIPELGAFGALGKDRIGSSDPARDGRGPAGLERCIAGHGNPSQRCRRQASYRGRSGNDTTIDCASRLSAFTRTAWRPRISSAPAAPDRPCPWPSGRCLRR